MYSVDLAVAICPGFTAVARPGDKSENSLNEVDGRAKDASLSNSLAVCLGKKELGWSVAGLPNSDARHATRVTAKLDPARATASLETPHIDNHHLDVSIATC